MAIYVSTIHITTPNTAPCCTTLSICLVIYFIFMLLFNMYCITLPPPYTYDENSASNCTVTTQQAVFPVANQWFAQTDGTGCYDVPLYNKPCFKIR